MNTFIARPQQNPQLVAGYLRFPELIEIFHNVVLDRPLHEGVVSEWDGETLRGHIKNFIIPLLEQSCLIERDEKRSSSYRANYSSLIFEGLSRASFAKLAARRAQLVAERLLDDDDRNQAISANLFFPKLSQEKSEHLINELRTVLKKYLDESSHEEGVVFRLALVARTENKLS